MDYQGIVVALIVTAALAYAGWKVWKAVSPHAKAGGCGCASAASGCGGCPLTKGRSTP